MVADKRHTGVAQGVQVLHDLLHAFAVVDADIGDVFFGSTNIVEDHWNPIVVEHLDQIGVHFRDDGGQACHAPANHQAGAGHQLLGLIISVGHYHLITAVVSIGFERPEDVKEEGVLHVGDDDSKGAASA